jgi:flavorubredoxin/flavin reductase (DIM6/NTAB) family NADH-FMN oxidoreductase RutF
MAARDVQICSIAPHTTVLRSRTWDRLKFEVEYARKRGTTANTYLIRADWVALLDPPGASFTDAFLEALQACIDPQQIDYIILSHLNPNRGETLRALLAQAPQATVVCSNPAAVALPRILPEQRLDPLVVKGDRALDLGQGHQLEFLLAPTPRWPDALCSYDPATRILFSDKFFGAHVCGEAIFDEGWSADDPDRRYYFDCLMAPHAGQVATHLEKLAAKPAQLYATGHGPLVRDSLSELTAAYRRWAQQQQEQPYRVALLYASAYGNTATIAQAIARGIEGAGVAVDALNCEFAEPETVRTTVARADGFAIGSPTLGGHLPTQIQTALGIVLSTADTSQLAGAFGSYGWSGEAVDLLESKLRHAGYPLGFEPIRVKFKPTEAVLQSCEEAGAALAQKVRKQGKQRAYRQLASESQAPRAEQAVRRVVGSLCAVTALRGERTGVLLTSWVSQATFVPPGVTVAVPQTHPVAAMLAVGERFALNVLPEGTQLPKHLTDGEGEACLANLETATGESGCPLLQGALAHLECRADNYMECGDCWLVYAIAESGRVLDERGVTAVRALQADSYS